MIDRERGVTPPITTPERPELESSNKELWKGFFWRRLNRLTCARVTLHQKRDEEPYRIQYSPSLLDSFENGMDKALFTTFRDILALADPDLVETAKANFEWIRKNLKKDQI